MNFVVDGENAGPVDDRRADGDQSVVAEFDETADGDATSLSHGVRPVLEDGMPASDRNGACRRRTMRAT
jgi:hypothetical protein